MNKIIIIGSGGHAMSCIDVILSIKKFKIYGIINKTTKTLLTYKFLGNDKSLVNHRAKCKYAFIGIGQIRSSDIRIKIYKKLKTLKFELPKIISKKSSVSNFSHIEESTIVMHNSYVGPKVNIGKNCIINTASILEHECIIEDHCHISTNVTLNGNVTIGKGSFIGSGTIIKEGVKIPPFSFIKMGSIVKK